LVPLARLARLKELRLDLNLRLENDKGASVRSGIEQQRALLVAEKIPQLQVLGFLIRLPDGLAFWYIRHVFRDGKLRVQPEDPWYKYPWVIFLFLLVRPLTLHMSMLVSRLEASISLRPCLYHGMWNQLAIAPDSLGGYIGMGIQEHIQPR